MWKCSSDRLFLYIRNEENGLTPRVFPSLWQTYTCYRCLFYQTELHSPAVKPVSLNTRWWNKLQPQLQAKPEISVLPCTDRVRPPNTEVWRWSDPGAGLRTPRCSRPRESPDETGIVSSGLLQIILENLRSLFFQSLTSTLLKLPR